MKAEEILLHAAELISGPRDQEYGDRLLSFTNIVKLWNAYLGDRIDPPLEPGEIGVLLSLMKTARLKSNRKPDTFVDGSAYLALAGEMMADDPVQEDS